MIAATRWSPRCSPRSLPVHPRPGRGLRRQLDRHDHHRRRRHHRRQRVGLGVGRAGDAGGRGLDRRGPGRRRAHARRVDSLWATDEEILVLDTQVPIIRVYDHDGTFLRNIGRGGQGPGEYARPFSIGADAAGRLFVADPGNGRISLYSIDGQYLEGWTVGSLWCCVTPMVVTAEGVPYLEVIDPETYAGPDGPIPCGPTGPLARMARCFWPRISRSRITGSASATGGRWRSSRPPSPGCWQRTAPSSPGPRTSTASRCAVPTAA